MLFISSYYLFLFLLPNAVLCLSGCCKREVRNSARSDHCQSYLLDIFSSGAVFDGLVNTSCVCVSVMVQRVGDVLAHHCLVIFKYDLNVLASASIELKAAVVTFCVTTCSEPLDLPSVVLWTRDSCESSRFLFLCVCVCVSDSQFFLENKC